MTFRQVFWKGYEPQVTVWPICDGFTEDQEVHMTSLAADTRHAVAVLQIAAL